MLPKLNEIEQQQDQLIRENEMLKKEKNIQVSLLKNIKTLLKSEDQNKTIIQVYQLIDAYL